MLTEPPRRTSRTALTVLATPRRCRQPQHSLFHYYVFYLVVYKCVFICYTSTTSSSPSFFGNLGSEHNACHHKVAASTSPRSACMYCRNCSFVMYSRPPSGIRIDTRSAGSLLEIPGIGCDATPLPPAPCSESLDLGRHESWMKKSEGRLKYVKRKLSFLTRPNNLI